jgi:hypothetical protein
MEINKPMEIHSMMNRQARKNFDEALQLAAFPAHDDMAQHQLSMASGLAHYAYLCRDIEENEYLRLRLRIRSVQADRDVKTVRMNRSIEA